MNARAEPAGGDEVLPFLRADRVVRAGVAIVVLFFFGFIGWAALAPLESAVISPGVVVSPLRPDDVRVAARVRPQDIEELQPGGTAKVEFGAYKARRMPMLTGTVTYISSDALLDARTGEPYFLVRISIDHAALKEYREARFLPGVPVQVEIPTGSHTVLEYFVGPIRDVMQNGMREK